MPKSRRFVWYYPKLSENHDCTVVRQFIDNNKTKRAAITDSSCGEPGIRTLEALLELTHFPGVRLRPLGQLSNVLNNVN